MVCLICREETERRGPSQKYCPVCARKVKARQNRKYRRYDETEPIQYRAVSTGGQWQGLHIDRCPGCIAGRDRFSDTVLKGGDVRAALRAIHVHQYEEHGVPMQAEQLELEGV